MSHRPEIRIAMWSGPRNISTALMRSWESRPDSVVCDEPLYAHYLLQTRRNHPGRDEVLAHHDSDAQRVIDYLTGPIPDGKPIFYQKHMAHHLLPGIPRDWVLDLENAFLIRSPREMLTSLSQFIPDPAPADTGLPQQWELFQQVRSAKGDIPPVIRARDVLDDPRRLLSALCKSLGVPFHESMLEWKAGPRDTDGVWGKYWYDAVNKSTGFKPYARTTDRVPQRLQQVFEACQEIYQELYAHRLQA